MITKYKNGNIDIRMTKDEINRAKENNNSDSYMIGAEYYHNQMMDAGLAIYEIDNCYYLVDENTRKVYCMPFNYSLTEVELYEDLTNDLAHGRVVKFKYVGKRKSSNLFK